MGFLIKLIIFIHSLIDKLAELIIKPFLGRRGRCPSLDENFFVTSSAVDVAEMIRKRKLTSFEVVSAYISRIEKINPVLNAVMDGPFMEALDEAKKVDELIQSSKMSEAEFDAKPFLGVPFTVKDSTEVADKLHTMALLIRKNKKGKVDAENVRIMKKAGAILICKSNTPEICMWQETRNYLIGQTRNPYDTRRSVGGSSGGEGVLISSAGSCFGLGTDIGGSIRIPSYMNGIFGHKPTPEIISTNGCDFRLGNEKGTMLCAGPMVRHAKDLKAIFNVLVGPEKVLSLKMNEPVDVKKLRFYYCLDSDDIVCSRICPDMIKTIKSVAEHFTSLTGRQVEFIKLKHANKTSRIWRYWMYEEPGDLPAVLGDGKTVNIKLEILKKFIGQSDLTLGAIYILIDSLIPKEDAAKMKKYSREQCEQIDEILKDDGILFYPSTTNPPPFHYVPYVQIFNFHYWSLFNALRLPSTQCPLGLNNDGVPLGIQVVANQRNDRLCLAVAEELERAFGGWVPPFKTKNIN